MSTRPRAARDRRRVIPALEVAAIAGAIAAAAWWPVWALIGLVAAGTASRWARGKGWIEPGVTVPGLVLAGVALGAVALGAAVVVAGPALERATARAVEWTELAALRGHLGLMLTALAIVAARAVAEELVYRRWIADRIHDAGARPIAAVLVAAAVEGAVTGGHVASRLGAAVAGIGVGLVYVGAGRRLAPAIACRLTFELGAVLLVWARVV